MKRTLLLRAKPGSEEVEIRTNKYGQSIPAHTVRIQNSVWEGQGEQKVSRRLFDKYMKKGMNFSRKRQKFIAKPRISYSVDVVTNAALTGSYEKIVSLLIKKLP